MIIRWFKRRRRRRWLDPPFPVKWREHLACNFAYWKCLDEDERRRIEDLSRILIAEKYWEGCGGLTLIDEMKITIAAQACLLILNLGRRDGRAVPVEDAEIYPGVRAILVYPSGYFAPSRSGGPGGMVVESRSAVLGQAHYRGPVILSWSHARQGGRNASDGHNLVYHEFAHKLDMDGGIVNGTPILRSREQYREWHEVMTREFESLINAHDQRSYWGLPTDRHVLRPYGATNPAEFFAVATESFFEQSERLREHHPDLYRVLRQYYDQDPADREQRCRDASRVQPTR